TTLAGKEYRPHRWQRVPHSRGPAAPNSHRSATRNVGSRARLTGGGLTPSSPAELEGGPGIDERRLVEVADGDADPSAPGAGSRTVHRGGDAHLVPDVGVAPH